MTKTVATHLSCTICGHHECVTEFEWGKYCNSCGGKVYNNGGKKEDTVEVEEKLREVTKEFRGISKETCEFYNVTVSIDNKGKDVRHVYPYPHGNKYRYLPKDFSRNKGFKNNHLFGMDKFNAGSSKYITIVEGEVDVLSAFEMLGGKSPVVGFAGGGFPEALLKNVHSYLDSFSEIILCVDNDDAGEKAALKISAAFPNKCYKVSLTKHKDANEFLEAGDRRDFNYAWINRKKYTPSGVYNTPSQFRHILHRQESNDYIPTPIDELNNVIKGNMQGHLTILTGPEGQGKTEVIRLFEYNILKNHPDKPIAVLHMEESKKTCLTSYACYSLENNLRDPDHTVDQDVIDKAIDELTKRENLYLFDMGVDDNPLEIIDKVKYFATVCGCKYIFIDPIQQLAYSREGDRNEEQILSQVSVQLEKIATELNVGIVLTAHVNDNGDTRSSRMIGKSASVRIDISRDHMNADDEIRNTTKLSVSKNRPTGRTGFGGLLTFDPDTFTLKEKA